MNIELIITAILIPLFVWQQIQIKNLSTKIEGQDTTIDKLKNDKIDLKSIILDLINAVQVPHQARARTELIKAVKEKLDLLV
jgi:hypothetical protein